jgi:hypothetical protein
LWKTVLNMVWIWTEAGTVTKTFPKSEPELERQLISTVPQHLQEEFAFIS